MTVFDNIAFGLEVQKEDKAFIKERVTELVGLIGLSGLEKRYPHQLSGGQRQRVAFARALAPNPHLLLLDEPFAAIDAKVRKELRSWLRETIAKVGITSIFVTHDQDEAIEVADEIIITNRGRIEQKGSPLEIYKNPATPFSAQFIGQSSVLDDYSSLHGYDKVDGFEKAIIRPEFVSVTKPGEEQYVKASEHGIITDTFFRGDFIELRVNIQGMDIVARRSLEEIPVQKGDQVSVLIYRLYLYNKDEVCLLENSNLTNVNQVFI
jgi:sulfate transport system ATP-binding protein